ncbi:MAG: hypothetical protein OEW29_12775 [Acidimicrobiia bacterium]|nr:hypothetical protein [Acidimicrobiia bacterium]MDH4365504.1 hypothetical protein [Acidimicrobiia bacterium]
MSAGSPVAGSTASSAGTPEVPGPAPASASSPASTLERRGRRWMVCSFLACPCHLPWTLALLGSMFGGTVLGAVLRDHTLVAGLLVASTWLAGTTRGFWLVHKGQRGELVCALPTPPRL